MRQRGSGRGRPSRGGSRSHGLPGGIGSRLRRRTGRSAVELASGRQSIAPVAPALFAAGGGVGALLAYFLDPARGKGRRDRMTGVAWRGLRGGRRQLRRVASDAAGTAERVVRHEPARRKEKELDEVALAAKVETELFGNRKLYGDRSIPKGALNLDVEKGVVVLRGQVDAGDRVHEIEEAVRRIPGVRDVRNLLHPSGTPAPNKAAALRASSRSTAGREP